MAMMWASGAQIHLPGAPQIPLGMASWQWPTWWRIDLQFVVRARIARSAMGLDYGRREICCAGAIGVTISEARDVVKQY